MRAKLISQSEKWGFEQPRVTLGRSAKCDIRVSDVSASRIHAQLRVDMHGRYLVMDCGSRNGTLLNEELLVGPILLNNNDVIRIGDQEFVFQGNNEPCAFEAKARGSDIHSIIMLAVCLQEDEKALSRENSAYGCAFGQWFEAQECAVIEQEGVFDSIDRRGFFAYWRTEERMVRPTMGQVLAFVKESQKITGRMSEELQQAIAGEYDRPLLAVGSGLHYGVAEGRRLTTQAEPFYVMGGAEVELARDMANRAVAAGEAVLCGEKTQALLPDLSSATPFAMSTVGPSQQTMLLYKLKI